MTNQIRVGMIPTLIYERSMLGNIPMRLFEKTAKFFGYIKVSERSNEVKVTGIDGYVMARHIKELWETEIINKMMFNSITDTSVSLSSFFISDFVYMLKKLRESKKVTWASRRTIDKILHGIMTNTWFKMTVGPVKPMIDDKRLSLIKWKPMPIQLSFLHAYGDLMPRYGLRGFLLAFGPGLGKAQPLDSLISTPSGWIRMGDIKLDDVVSTPDGSTGKVVGVYPQGIRDVYEITLEGNRSARSCDDHLWKVKIRDREYLLTLVGIRHIREDVYIPVYLEEGKIYWRKIVKIERVSHEHVQCISIDHPDHLYITDDNIVTHNTFTDLMVATCVIPPSIAEVKIIISPKKALHLVWEKSLLSVFKKKPTYWVSDSGLPMPKEHCEYYVFNFEQIPAAILLAEEILKSKKRYFVIVDETHNFADERSDRTKRLVKLQTLRDDIFTIWTSGTPILKSGAELVSFLKCTDPRFDSDAERRFKRIYAASPGRAAEIFFHRLGLMMAYVVPQSEESAQIKVTIKEIPVRLPTTLAKRFLMSTVREDMKEFIKERLEFYTPKLNEYRKYIDKTLNTYEHSLKSRADRKEFNAYKTNLRVISQNPDVMLTDIMAAAKAYERTKLLPWLPSHERKVFRGALSAIKNIKMKVRGEALGTILSRRRAECAAVLGTHCKPEIIIKDSLSKTLFFSSSVLPVLTLTKYLKEKGFNPLPIYADTNADLTKNMEEFDINPELNPICATMMSLSEAVPVTAASTVVFLNRPFRENLVKQVIARSARIGQKLPVTVYEITLDTGNEPNVSSTTDDILRDVREMISALMGPEIISYRDEDKEILETIVIPKSEDIAILDKM